MKKLLASVALLLSLASPSFAACTAGSLPVQLQEGTTAHATDVMANFNQILSGVAANCAGSGANSDITAINGLVTPLAPAVGGSSVYFGTTSVGTPNAQAIASTTPSGFTLTTGMRVSFLVGVGNTGAMTLSVAGTTAKNVMRPLPNGLSQLAGGELFVGALTEVIYDGTQYVLLTNYSPGVPGTVIAHAGPNVPAGYAECNGQLLSQAAFPALFAAIGGGWNIGGEGAGTFRVPDLNGRLVAGRDNATGRITAAGGNFTANIVGSTGGLQNQTLVASQLPVITPTFTGTPNQAATFGGTAAAFDAAFTGNSQTVNGNQSNVLANTGGGTVSNTTTNVSVNTITPTFTFTPTGTVGMCAGGCGVSGTPGVYQPSGTVTFTATGTVSGFGGNLPHTILQPTAIVLYLIKL